jgi:hypothetical protein
MVIPTRSHPVRPANWDGPVNFAPALQRRNGEHAPERPAKRFLGGEWDATGERCGLSSALATGVCDATYGGQRS